MSQATCPICDVSISYVYNFCVHNIGKYNVYYYHDNTMRVYNELEAVIRDIKAVPILDIRRIETLILLQ